MTFSEVTDEKLPRKLPGSESLTLTELAFAQRSESIGDDESTDAIDDGRIQSKVTDFS